MKSKILQRESPVLREIAKEVPFKSIHTQKVKSVIERMKKALHAEEDGVAIAAPQIGTSLRIFIVAGRTIALIKKEEGKEYPDQIYINPVLIKFSKKKKKMEEGCLSVRWLYGEVERSEKVTINAHDEHGKKIHLGASGLLAQIFQHEVDHLNGILFIDKAEHIEDIPPEKNKHE
jgi:peptide deformylase